MAWNWSGVPKETLPPGFTSRLAGQGSPGQWKIIEDLVPSLLPTFTPDAAKGQRKHVLAQVSRDPTDERFPMLIHEGTVFGDFKISTRFKLAAGEKEQMAGIAFRVQDERNYYYIRASALGNTFNFFKIVEGVRSPPIGVKTNIATGQWHHMTVECEGSVIRATFNGAAILPELNDLTFTRGKLGFWTKSDSVSYFTDVTIDYTPLIPLVQKLVEETLDKYPRIIGLKIVAPDKETGKMIIQGSDDSAEIGQPGRPEEANVMEENVPYAAKARKQITMSFPMHDRNGDPMAVVRLVLKRFPGQTEKNALARGRIVVRSLATHFQSRKDLLE